MQELNDAIFKRKSTRNYDLTPLSKEELSEIDSFIQQLTPLYESIKTECNLADEVTKLFSVKAPHYYLIYSENKDGYLENTGFLYQQLSLFLTSKGIGSCWLGMAKPLDKIENGLEFVVTLAFGRDADNPYRSTSDFNRKPLNEIAKGMDERLECARLAPSATNSQNWFFICENGAIHVYQKNLKPVQRLLLGRLNRFDIGIALCHLFVATKASGKKFSYTVNNKVKPLAGYTYVGTVN